jgi:hypothetical protein
VIDDVHLDVVLASIGSRLVLDPAESTVRAPQPARASWQWRRWLGGGVAATVLAVVGLSPVRGAVADWLGIGSTHVEVRPDADAIPEDLPGIQAGATPISRRQAEDRLDPSLVERLNTTDLGPPAGFATIIEGGVLVVWPDHTTLWVHGGQADARRWLEKLVASDQQVQPVDHLGDDALALVGDHVLTTPARTVAAGTTVLWTRGSTELRLAGDRPVDDLIEIARNLDGG